MQKTRAIFLDRDGTINVKSSDDYIKRKEDFFFMPGALEAITKISSTDYKIIVVTNQQCIGKGLVSHEEMSDIHKYMQSEITLNGGRLDEVYYCPHLAGTCTCRKPLPGMLDLAGVDFNIDFNQSWMVGDDKVDMTAGKAKNCKTIFLGEEKLIHSDYLSNNLEEAASIVLKWM